jgi:hypothetical protein
MDLYNWIIFQSRLPWLKIMQDCPHDEMLAEARAVRSRFVAHRYTTGETHQGWSSLVVHGLGPECTLAHESYGYDDIMQAPHAWTEIADLCPVTKSWIESLEFEHLFRVRFMLLEAGGFIAEHTDTDQSRLFAYNVALNQPEECVFTMTEHGPIPFNKGDTFLLDVSNSHHVYNNSNEDRYHIIIHGVPGAKARDRVVKSFLKNKK